ERLTEKSTAVIHISKYLGGVWPLCMIALVIPPFIRDFIYDIIAKNRYRWFGKYDTCRLHDPKYEARFYS
ncbi:MAG: DCC1-like thiol-disulfide oxidoreductase family protein, partial [Nitrospinota bacterium]|nr:DCC1-like thiol-disulfide oxidoreductase family protein [Nitrospinota bacterium]